MRISWPTPNDPRWMWWVSLLTGAVLFAVFDLILSIVVPTETQTPAVVRSGVPVHRALTPSQINLFVDLAAALLAIVVGPYLVLTFDRMQRQVAKQNAELQSLHTIDNAINAQLNLQAILNVAIREATIAVDGEAGALWLFDRHSDASVASTAYFNIPPALHTLLSASLDRSDIAAAKNTGRPSRRQGLDATWTTDEVAAALHLRNTIVVPIFQARERLGAFLIANRGGALNPLADSRSRMKNS